MRFALPAAVLSACLAAAADGGDSTPACRRYSVEIVATLVCEVGGDLVPWGISDNGTVAGEIFCGIDPDVKFPYLSSDRGFSLLPMPSGYPYGKAWGVNDAGFVAGQMHPTSAGINRRAFLYDGRAVVNLGTLPGTVESFAYAISDEAPPTVVGNTGSPVRAVRWVNGAIEQLVLPMGPNSVAADVSPDGHIAGWMGTSNFAGPASAFVWHRGRVTTLLALRGAFACEATAVNDNGDACGSCLFDLKGTLMPLRKGVFWKDGKPIDLGVLPDKFHCFALDLTNDGTILGYCTDQFGSFSENFVWRAGTMVALTPLIDSPPDLAFGHAYAINNAGQITIFAVIPAEDTFYAIRLTPVPPLLGDLTCDWSVDGADLAILLGAWGPVGADAAPSADLDADGDVDAADLALLLGAWTGS